MGQRRRILCNRAKDALFERNHRQIGQNGTGKTLKIKLAGFDEILERGFRTAKCSRQGISEPFADISRIGGIGLERS